MAAALAALTFMGGMAAEAAQGVVALVANDKVVVEDEMGSYTCGTIYLGDFYEGDIVYGEFDRSGLQKWYNASSNMEVQILVDYFWASAEYAMDYIRR